ncbi:MAG: Gfo/Idh/MocA family oxidoreductase [Rhodospirillaceae bacterium]|nr:Gfo/Idh/MocA family oxidoreductase [Rhodospirillaceae bacterium]
MAMLRLAVIGAGLIGREHCTLIREHPGAELVGLADVSEDAASYAQGIRVPYYADYQQLLDDTKPDGVIVAVPNQLHVAAGGACLSRGIPCLVEKPIADTVPAARELVEAAETAGVPILVGHHRRHSPDIREARRIIEAGALGNLVAVNGMWMLDKPDNYFEAEWRRSPGGGPLLINLIHEIDCLRFIVGEIDSVRAFTSNAVRGFGVEDTATIALRFENGVLGSFLMSDAVASPYSWEVTSGQALYFPHQPGDCYFFGGRDGALAVPSMNLWRHDGAGKNWQDPLLRQHMPLDGSRTYRNQLDHFLAVVSGDVVPVVTARDGMMTLAATLAVETAAREDRTVTLAEMLS